MKVKDVMHRDAIWVGPDTPLPQVAAKFRGHEIDAVPISEYDRLVGIVTERDVASRKRADAKTADRLSARDVMSKPIAYCYADEEVDDAVRIMHKHDVHYLPVVSRQKRIVGSLTLADIDPKAGRNAAA